MSSLNGRQVKTPCQPCAGLQIDLRVTEPMNTSSGGAHSLQPSAYYCCLLPLLQLRIGEDVREAEWRSDTEGTNEKSYMAEILIQPVIPADMCMLNAPMKPMLSEC